MTSSSFEIRLETDGDAQMLSELSAQAFGPGRFTRSAYRVREGVPPVGALCLCGLLDERLVGGIRFTAIRIGDEEGAAEERLNQGSWQLETSPVSLVRLESELHLLLETMNISISGSHGGEAEVEVGEREL